MSYPTTEVEGPRHERRATVRRVGIALLVLFLVVVMTGALGPRTAQVSAAGPVTELDVTHPAVVRSGLASEMTATWRQEEGVGATRLSVDPALLAALGIERIEPAPRGETSDGTRLLLDFEPTGAQSYTVTFSGRVPTRATPQKLQWELTLLDPAAPLTVEATTWVLP
ncbi:hypothetical protein [Nocardioides gilvus]|uniref:hypothetical protein n=1 Tax=Nocardioides gilvus TaxID=1735589 RepID=UPI000D7406CA|nr:hypothetical protein [Nocardioides gilvus]